jgi:hypothetical protein
MANPKSKKSDCEDETMKSRKKKFQKDMEDDADGEDMNMSEDGDDDDGDDDAKDSKKGKKKMPPWLKNKVSKGNDDDEDLDEDDDAEDDDEPDMKKKAKKSMNRLTPRTLEKSIAMLQEFYESKDPDMRKSVLTGKLHSEGTLSKSERNELLALMDGTAEREETESLSKSVVSAMNEPQEIRDTIEISDFMDAHHSALTKSLGMLGDEVEGMKRSQHEHNLLMAQAICDIGNVVKSLARQEERVSATPARGPKAMGTAAPLEKSFRGEGEQMDLRAVKGALLEMVDKSYQSGRDGKSEGGHDLTKAVTMFESSRELTGPVASEVKAFLRSKRG